MEQILLHHDAVNRMNELATRLLDFVHEADQRPKSKGKINFIPDIPVDATITEEDIDHLEISEADAFGNEVAKYFTYDGRTYGLEKSDYQEFASVAERIQALAPLRNIVSKVTLRAILFTWIQKAWLRETALLPCEYITIEVEKAIQKHEVWVPIAWMSIENDVTVGRVVFKQVTQAQYDKWIQQAIEASNEHGTTQRAIYENERNNFQGYAAGVVSIEAEEKRAKEYALEQVESSLAMLHVFSPGALHPLITINAQMRGRNHIPSYKLLQLTDEKPTTIESGLSQAQSPLWILDSVQIEKIRKVGLDRLSEILVKTDRSEFEQQILDAMLVYSRVATSDKITDKLIYLFAPFESLFLKDGKESIAQNLAERLALFVGKTQDEKLTIRDRVRRVYGSRSQFLHHAQQISDVEDLKLFMLDAWLAFTKVIANSHMFSTHIDLLQSIDDYKLR